MHSHKRALGVLGHQKRFLREHRAGLEKWTSAVYGFKLSIETCRPSGAVGAAIESREKHDGREPRGGGALLREVRVNVKCKGTKRKIDRQPLLAHVDQTWFPRHTRCKSVKKRSSVKTGAEKTAKRVKSAFAKVDQAVVVEASSVASNTEEILNDGLADGQREGMPSEQGATGRGWNEPDSRNPCALSCEGQPLHQGFSLVADTGPEVVSSLTPSGSSGPAGAKAVVDPGTSQPARLMCRCRIHTVFPWRAACSAIRSDHVYSAICHPVCCLICVCIAHDFRCTRRPLRR